MKKLIIILSCTLVAIIMILGQLHLDSRKPFSTEPVNEVKASINPEETIGTYSYLLIMKAKDGDPSAQETLAMMYFMGANIKPNKQKAIYWFEQAATNGNEDATLVLATAYLFGSSTVGIEKNVEKGIYWTKKVALCESEERETRIHASEILSDLYARGDEIPRDLGEAFRWHKLATVLHKD